MTSAVRREPRRVAVIGAGVIGVTAAARIAERGVEVVLLTAETAGSTPVSRASFAWVNTHAKSPDAYRRLNDDGRRAHTTLSAARATPWFLRTGAEIDGIEYADDGYVDTRAYLGAQFDDFRQAGGSVREGVRIDSIDQAREVVGPVDTIVVAAGAGTVQLLGAMAARSVRLETSAGDDGFLARIDVGEHPIDRIRSIDGLQARPDGDGRVAVQSLRIEAALRRDGVTASVASVWPALRTEIAHALSWQIADDVAVRVDHAVRPHAADGFPLAGAVADDVYVALSHSGVTLAPVLGELIARDLCGDPDPRLAPFRP